MSDASHEVLTASFDHVSERAEPVVWTTLVRALLPRDAKRTKGNAMFVKFQDAHMMNTTSWPKGMMLFRTS